MEHLLTTEDVANYLRVDVVTVRRLVAKGELPAYRVGGEYRFMRPEIEDYVRRQRIVNPETSDMFSKFTERARKVLSLAREEAERLKHNYIGTEHLLLGLVSEGEGVAARVLRDLGIELTTISSEVEFAIGVGTQDVYGQIGLTPRAKKAIELAVDEAKQFGHHYLGTEHLLLGLLREGNGIAADILKKLGVKLEQVRARVLLVLSTIEDSQQTDSTEE